MAGLFDAETETLARAFAASSAAFLERLRWMTAALGPPYEFPHSFERGREIKWNTIFLHDFIKPINGPEWQTTGVSWAPPEIDFMAFNTHAWQTREGWLVAKEFNAELSKFDCSTLKKLSSVMLKPDFRGGLACFLETCASQINKLNELGDDASEIDRLEAELNVLQYVLLIRVVLEFHQAVERFALFLSVTTQPLTAAAAVPPPTKPAKRIRTKKRWTFPEIDTHIEQVLKSGDSEKIKAYVFEADEELASRIGCNKKTLYKTQFWQDERERMQAEWRRLNTAGEIPKKRDQ